MISMPISYAERKKRRQALLQGLKPELRERLALRHVEAVAKLSPQAQRTLASALSSGMRSIPAAIAHLRERPFASAEEVLNAGRDGRGGSEAHEEPSSPSAEAGSSRSPLDPDARTLSELSDLLQDCFPGMPGMTASALAADELFAEVLSLSRAWRACLQARSILSELVFVALCGLTLRFIDELDHLGDSRPHYRGALARSGLRLRWPGRPAAGELTGGRS
jgi:hypothetical protein